MSKPLRLNVGSGQRRFGDSDPSGNRYGWVNIDCVSRPPDQVPDLICDVGREPLPFPDGTVDMVCLHHVLEHAGCGEGDSMLMECHRVLRPGGSIIICLPDLKQLALAWLAGKISDFIYMVNLMGAYQGLESDRHKWHYTPASMEETLRRCGAWSMVGPFDWRAIPGADIAKDFWIAGYEAAK